MSKQAEADLILKLYDLRREPTMRAARDWFNMNFFPETAEDVKNAMFSEHSGHLRMVVSYWDMAATLVNHGAISMDLFNDANGEHFGAFGRMAPVLSGVREMIGPMFLANLEKLIDATPGGRERAAMVRERMLSIRQQFQAMRQGG